MPIASRMTQPQNHPRSQRPLSAALLEFDPLSHLGEILEAVIEAVAHLPDNEPLLHKPLAPVLGGEG